MIDPAIKQDLKYLFLASRPHQWVKNSIVFFPLFFSKNLFDINPMSQTFCIFFIFCMMASSGYLLNDILDYDVDINHPDKSQRPFAAGQLNKEKSIFCATVLATSGLLLTYVFCRESVLIIATYFITTSLYNLWLKKIVIIDLICIAIFYLLRILSGATSADVIPSLWIIFCTAFLSIYLGLSKRYFDCHFTGASEGICRYYGTSIANNIVRLFAASLIFLYFLYVINQLDNQTSRLIISLLTVAFVIGGITRHVYLVFNQRYGGDAIIMLLKDRWLFLSVLGWFALTGFELYLP